MAVDQFQASGADAKSASTGDERHLHLLKQAVGTLRLAPILKLLSMLPKAPSDLLEIAGTPLTPSAYALRLVRDEGMRFAIAAAALAAARNDVERIEAIAPGRQAPNFIEVHMMLLGSLDGTGLGRLRETLQRTDFIDSALAGIWTDSTNTSSRLAYANLLIDKGISLAPEAGWCRENPFNGFGWITHESLEGLSTTWPEIKQTISRMLGAGADINARYEDEKNTMGWLSPLERLLLAINSTTLREEATPHILEMVSFLIANGAKTQNGNVLEFIRTVCPSKMEMLGPVATHAVISSELGSFKASEKPALQPTSTDDTAATLKKRKITIY